MAAVWGDLAELRRMTSQWHEASADLTPSLRVPNFETRPSTALSQRYVELDLCNGGRFNTTRRAIDAAEELQELHPGQTALRQTNASLHPLC